MCSQIVARHIEQQMAVDELFLGLVRHFMYVKDSPFESIDNVSSDLQSLTA